MTMQRAGQRIKVHTFIIVPETCPGDITITCDCCEHAGEEFLLTKSSQGDFGFVACSYPAENEKTIVVP